MLRVWRVGFALMHHAPHPCTAHGHMHTVRRAFKALGRPALRVNTCVNMWLAHGLSFHSACALYLRTVTWTEPTAVARGEMNHLRSTLLAIDILHSKLYTEAPVSWTGYRYDVPRFLQAPVGTDETNRKSKKYISRALRTADLSSAHGGTGDEHETRRRTNMIQRGNLAGQHKVRADGHGPTKGRLRSERAVSVGCAHGLRAAAAAERGQSTP